MISLLAISGVGYLLLCAVMFFAQRSLLYFPHRFTRAHLDELAHEARLERWENSSGGFIGLKRPSPQQPSIGSIVFTYGNGSTAIHCAHYVNDIQSAGAFDVYVLEYPGYADRSGKPTQSALFRAADEALQTLPAHRPIYLVGESLGSGVASYLAGTHPNQIAGMLLISPFNRLSDVAQYHYRYLPVSLLLADRFASQDYLRDYHGKVGIIIDCHDAVVPEQFGRRLYDSYLGPKKLWEFPEGGHCQITEPPVNFWREVVRFWQN